jgi:hypothetical protein
MMGMWQLLFVLFPVALTLSILVKLSVAHRRLQPSAFLELRELSFGVGCGCVLAQDQDLDRLSRSGEYPTMSFMH